MSSARPLIHSGRLDFSPSSLENKRRLRTSARVQEHVLGWRRRTPSPRRHLLFDPLSPPPPSSFYHQRHAAPLCPSFFQLRSDSDTSQPSDPLRMLRPPQLKTISLLSASLCCSFASFHPFLSLGSAPAGPVLYSLMMLDRGSRSRFLFKGMFLRGCDPPTVPRSSPPHKGDLCF